MGIFKDINKVFQEKSAAIVSIQFVVIVILGSILVYQKRFEANIIAEYIRTEIDTASRESSNQPSGNLLKAEFFDDITGGWGDGKPDGSVEWKAANSKYAPRTTPTSVIHPLAFNTSQEKLVATPRSELLAKIDPSGEKNMTGLIEETAKKYGEVRATHFVSTGQYILTQRYFDVDKDGVKEEIIETMGIGSNHPPHEGFIIKNNTIILSLPLNSGGIDPTTNGNGFYVKHQLYEDQPMCCPLKYRLYRVIYEDGKFIPVWEQDVSYLRFAP